jgi:hypothetical protein
MWEHLPADLVLHVGTFIHHRDARCMQSTCTSWEQIWTRIGLASPHPDVQHIELCSRLFCTNRQFVIDTIEPFIRHRTSPNVIQFMTCLIPVKVIASVTHMIGYASIEDRCKQFEKSMVFWCRCAHHVQTDDIPVVLVNMEDDRDVHLCSYREAACTDSLYVWAFLIFVNMCIFFVPMAIIVTLCLVIMTVLCIAGNFLLILYR